MAAPALRPAAPPARLARSRRLAGPNRTTQPHKPDPTTQAKGVVPTALAGTGRGIEIGADPGALEIRPAKSKLERT